MLCTRRPSIGWTTTFGRIKPKETPGLGHPSKHETSKNRTKTRHNKPRHDAKPTTWSVRGGFSSLLWPRLVVLFPRPRSPRTRSSTLAASSCASWAWSPPLTRSVPWRSGSGWGSFAVRVDVRNQEVTSSWCQMSMSIWIDHFGISSSWPRHSWCGSPPTRSPDASGTISTARGDGVPDSVVAARGAGIRVVMITGDYLLTAIAIAKNVTGQLGEGSKTILKSLEDEKTVMDDI